MSDVGVRELKARLSEYLDRAARGEVIRVTQRAGRRRAVGTAARAVAGGSGHSRRLGAPRFRAAPTYVATVFEPAIRRGYAGGGPGRVSAYVDTSALLKLYFEEPDSDRPNGF